MKLAIHSNIHSDHAIAMLATYVYRHGSADVLTDAELDSIVGEFNFDAEYKDGVGLVLTLTKLGDLNEEVTLDA